MVGKNNLDCNNGRREEGQEAQAALSLAVRVTQPGHGSGFQTQTAPKLGSF